MVGTRLARHPRGVAGRRNQTWRQLTVWLHVLTSVGWMGQGLALVSLFVLSLAAGDPDVRLAAVSMAEHLDTELLAPLANASAFTGFVLAAATPWGFLRHYWVLTKFGITLVQLHVAIFLLSPAVHESVVAARSDLPGPTAPLLAGSILMVSAIAFQGWLSIAKPWSRTPWAEAGARGRAAKLPTAPRGTFVAIVFATVADLTCGVLLGFPMPAFSLIVLVVRLRARRRELRPPRRRETAEPALAAGRPSESVG